MDRQRALGVALALISATSFGCLPVLTKLVYDDGADTTGVLSFRFTLAAVVLLGLALARKERLPTGRRLVGLAALGGIGYSVEASFYFEALERIPAGLAALLLYLYPALVVLLTAVLARRLPTPLALTCVVAATAGTALTIGPVAGGSISGVLLGLGAAVSYAIYVVVGSRITGGTGPLATAAIVMGACALVYDAQALAVGADYPSRTGPWIALVGVAIVGTVVSVGAFFAALALLGPADTSVVSTIEPVVSVVLAVVVLDELLTPLQTAGGALVVVAVVVLARIGTGTVAAEAPDEVLPA